MDSPFPAEPHSGQPPHQRHQAPPGPTGWERPPADQPPPGLERLGAFVPEPPAPYPTGTSYPMGPAPPAPAPPEPETRPARRISPWPFVVAAVAGVLIGVAVLVVLRFGGGDQPPATAHGTGTPTAAPSASDDPKLKPTDVALTDHGTWVELRWTDHTDKKALYFVVGAPVGTTERKLTQPDHTTTTKVNGLRDDIDYCFNVVGFLTVDHVAHSDRVCTTRTTPSAEPTA